MPPHEQVERSRIISNYSAMSAKPAAVI